MPATTWKQTFAGSPRYEAIASIFALIDKPVLVTEVYALMNKVMQQCNAVERDQIPALVKSALVGREPVKVSPPIFG